MPSKADLTAARSRLSGHLRLTPTIELEGLLPEATGRSPAGRSPARHSPARHSTARLVLKLELLQHTGSFKARGALNAILAKQPSKGVVAASGGNHGAAVAWAARRCGVPAAIFVPASSPELKAARIRSYGAELHLVDGLYADALEESRAHGLASGATPVHAYDDPDVVAGQASLGLELLEQEDPTTVLVSCGGGGLYSGVSLACGERATVLPVEPEAAPSLHAAVIARRPVPVEVSGVAVDSLGAREAGTIATAVALSAGVTPLLVSDAAILAAQQLLWERLRVVAEPGGATALAALVGGAYEPAGDETVVVVVSGANTSMLPAERP